ncbi:maleylpyruvate isomerase family mycothiol-dependent enzyme [Streptomyces gardneri]|uniref:maleylpyruvate isomerase family mycothiol-dependent enzyme n=1 Tax=Nocardia sputi TaxID=2943705 RepID=UPI001894C1F4|nr:maleylpyruvate isomerase family mycothiol-dependent enzyme [Nocardia sputi]MBF6166888.1 maleylpyruvate isomerase family mycothiol-dependent enzyme [Streptomyces gardneri]MBF6206717.1 maleylpyruvate isomerase family mycothiol-dependent enzyme [Streptomyces gardneri]UAK31492.1 maleylpyruvate isomerase family mycothiol-dependent enzyme [Nocardia asteroides]
MTEDTTMSAEQIWRAVAAERAGLAALLAQLPETGWDHPSLCEGWRVREVVAHLVLSARADIGWILVNLIRARGSLDRAIRDTAIRHADRVTTGQLLDELRGSIDARVTALGTTPADRLMDLLVHGQDIAIPLGIAREMPSAAARVAMERIWTTGAPFHARRKFAGYRLVATDADWAAGDGAIITGPIAALLLTVTGRSQAWDQLSGDGAARFAADDRP